DIASALIAEGVFPSTAESVAKVSQGNLAHARLLVTDNYLARRQDAFASIASRLDGTGATVVNIVADLLEQLDKAAETLEAMHEREVKELDDKVALTGERGSGIKALADRHKRELRKLRTDELRSGLSIFAGIYKDLLLREPDRANGEEIIAAIGSIHKTISALGLNINESLALHSLLIKCPPLKSLAATR
ncbi:MAG: hypothetical protein ACKOQX_08905, partial [Actinomycetota bacterium]